MPPGLRLAFATVKRYKPSVNLFYMPYTNEAYSLGHEGTQRQFFAPADLPLNMFANQRELALRAFPHLPQPLEGVLSLGDDRTLEILPTLTPAQLTGLAEWRIHPRVTEKRALCKLKFDI